MLKSPLGQLNWSRLSIFAALLVLVAAVWTSQIRPHGPTLPSNEAGLGAAGVPGAALAEISPEAQTRTHPQDPTGWRALGESQFQAGHYAAAVTAYQRAVALAPSDAVTWSALGEARVMASQHDPMPAEALKDFREANGINPREPRSRYFLAVEKDLTGDHQGAINDWLALLGDTPPGAPWEADLRRTIEQVGRINRIDVATRIAGVHQPAPLPAVPGMVGQAVAGPIMPGPIMAGVPGPSAQDLQAASAIPPSQQAAMAQAMVARLESRLAADPHNAEGWAMLIRSRMTLDGPDKASAVLARAVVADPADAAQLRQQAAAMGVK